MTVNPWVLHNKSLFLLKLNSPFTAIEQLFSSDINFLMMLSNLLSLSYYNEDTIPPIFADNLINN